MYTDPEGLLSWLERQAANASGYVPVAQNTVSRICQGSLSPSEVEKATNNVLKNIELSDALAFASINPNGNPIIVNQNQDRIIREQIDKLIDSVIKEKAKQAYEDAKKNGDVVIK